MNNVFINAGFKIGDAFTVINSDYHNFAIGSTVTLDSVGDYETMANFTCEGRSFTQALTPDEVEPLASPAPTADNHTVIPHGIILGHRLVRGDEKTLTETLLSQPLPYPLSTHFKTVDSIGELFESIPLAYVRQCVEQTNITPFERVALLALIETMEINQ